MLIIYIKLKRKIESPRSENIRSGELRQRALIRRLPRQAYHLFIWLGQVLFVAHGIFSCGMQTLSCGMWDLAP